MLKLTCLGAGTLMVPLTQADIYQSLRDLNNVLHSKEDTQRVFSKYIVWVHENSSLELDSKVCYTYGGERVCFFKVTDTPEQPNATLFNAIRINLEEPLNNRKVLVAFDKLTQEINSKPEDGRRDAVYYILLGLVDIYRKNIGSRDFLAANVYMENINYAIQKISNMQAQWTPEEKQYVWGDFLIHIQHYGCSVNRNADSWAVSEHGDQTLLNNLIDYSSTDKRFREDREMEIPWVCDAFIFFIHNVEDANAVMQRLQPVLNPNL